MEKKYFDLSGVQLGKDGRVELGDEGLVCLQNQNVSLSGANWGNDYEDFGGPGGRNSSSCNNPTSCDDSVNWRSCTNRLDCDGTTNGEQCSNGLECTGNMNGYHCSNPAACGGNTTNGGIGCV